MALTDLEPEKYLRRVQSAQLGAGGYTVRLECGHELECSQNFLAAQMLCLPCLHDDLAKGLVGVGGAG
jgi:hypothetical protein